MRALALAVALALASPPVRADSGVSALPRLHAPARVWWRDWTGWALTATGSFALVVGATDLGLTVPRWSSSVPPANGENLSGRLAADLVVLTLGVACAAGAIARFVLVARRERRDRERYSFVPGGLAITF